MAGNICDTCMGPKATLTCKCCSQNVCKKCAEFVGPFEFAFDPSLAEKYCESSFCHPCYVNEVQVHLSTYEDNVQKAKSVQIYMANQGKETRLIKRLEDPVFCTDRSDLNEAQMTLAYQAVLKGFSALVDVKITGQKVKDNHRQHTLWQGQGVPAYIDPKYIPKDRSLWQNPN